MASGTGNLPNQSMSFSPFAILTAEEMNDLVENIESLADGSGIGDEAISTAKLDDGAVTSEKLTTSVGFYATSTANITTSPDDITSYTVVVDYGSNFAAGVFTAPVAGFYQFNANINVQNTATNHRIHLELLHNGSRVGFAMGLGVAGTHDPSANTSMCLELAQGDTVKLGAFADATYALATGSSFSGFLIGTV